MSVQKIKAWLSEYGRILIAGFAILIIAGGIVIWQSGGKSSQKQKVGNTQTEETEGAAERVLPEPVETEALSETEQNVTEQMETEQTEIAETVVAPPAEQPEPVEEENPDQEAAADLGVQEAAEIPASESVEAVAPALTVYDTGNASLNQLCDGIVYSIANDSMSEREKARAVYDWVENNIRYSGTTPITDWITGGISTLNSRKGNCFGFYSVSASLLTRLGIENMEIHEEDDSHFWNLVKVDGAWYHFDTTKGWGTERFLWTDAQMDAYEYDNGTYGVIRYNWDHSKYPATP